MTTLSNNRRLIQHLDGESKPVRKNEYSYYSNQYNLIRSEYFIYSSVLGKLLTEVNGDGTKKRTFVYGAGGVVATQEITNNVQTVKWEHRDASNASYMQTASNGDAYYLDSQAELDPLGSNVGTSNPYYSQSNYQQNLMPGGGGWGYPGFGDPFGGYSCRMDGFEMPCSQVMYALSVGIGVPDRNFNQAADLGRWEDFDDYSRMNDGFPGTGTRFVPNPFLHSGEGIDLRTLVKEIREMTPNSFKEPNILNGVSFASGVCNTTASFVQYNNRQGNWWKGPNNRKWYEGLTGKGPNGATGARSVALGRAALAESLSKFTFYTGTGISAVQMYRGDVSPAKGVLDIGMGYVGFRAGVPGALLSGAYFVANNYDVASPKNARVINTNICHAPDGNGYGNPRLTPYDLKP